MRIGFICFGRSTFDVVAAQKIKTRSEEVLLQLGEKWESVSELVTTPAQAQQAADQLAAAGVETLVAQFTTFVDGRFIELLATRLGVPVLIWALREPGGRGERLALNSLTGANMAGERLHRLGVPFRLIYGDPGEAGTDEQLRRALRVQRVYTRLRRFTVVTVGDAPDGFFFSAPRPEVLRQLGVRVENLDLHDTFRRAGDVPDERARQVLSEVKQKVVGLDRLESDTTLKFARLHAMLSDDLRRLGADALAVRCWPEFFTEFGAAACSTISAFTDQGVMGACEADILGALSMAVLHEAADGAAYLGDLVEIDEKNDAVVFWHCGAGAFSLARADTGAVAGRHPNRQIGFTLEFGLKPGRVTILRVGEERDGTARALIGTGEVMDEPQRFLGTSGKVKLDGGDVMRRTRAVMEAGFEPHYALAYGDVAQELKEAFRLLGVPVTDF